VGVRPNRPPRAAAGRLDWPAQAHLGVLGARTVGLRTYRSIRRAIPPGLWVQLDDTLRTAPLGSRGISGLVDG
jgi:hypothetical protein